MGSILGLGRGKKAAKLANQGFNFLQDNPLIQQSQDTGSSALRSLSDALGLGSGQTPGESFLNSPGFQFELDQGRKLIENSQAGSGLLRSGSTLKALQRFGQGLASTRFNSFLDRLQGLSGAGQTAALGVGAAGSQGGSAAAAAQPQNKGILGRFFGI